MTVENSITFYYSIGSRYSYLASTQIESLASRLRCSVEWVPVDGFELRSLSSSEPFRGEAQSGQYRSPFREQDIAAWAAYYGVAYREPPDENGKLWWTDFDFRTLARAAVAGMRLGRTADTSRALFNAMFASQIWPVDESTCIDCAVDAGLDRNAFVHALSESENERALSELAEQAAAAGAFGVPSFIIAGRLFFGNDRLVLLEHHMRTRA